MDSLLDSINEYGIQVPVSVYRSGRRYILIDGERRWRCAQKLNLKQIPALIQDEPSALGNILLMFNIHALREQWDLLTIALKLRDIMQLIEEEGESYPTESELSKRTGLTRGVIRRCRYLLNLPNKYHEQILKELEKPKNKQKLTEDFFIEMERALRTVEIRMPEVIPNKNKVRDILITKFRNEIIQNRVHFRKVAMIARAENVEADPQHAVSALESLFARNSVSIDEAFERSVAAAYEDRDVATRIDSLVEQLKRYLPDDLDDELIIHVQELRREINRLLKG